MQNLTKAQVIALFIGAASAGTLENLNALSDTAQVAESGDLDKDAAGNPQVFPLQVAATGVACEANGTCAADGQKCASIQDGDTQGAGLCVAEWMCGALGKTAQVPFFVQCWTEVAAGETAAAPAKVDTTAYLAAVEGLITKTIVNWNEKADLIVSPKFNYMDGWWDKAVLGDTRTSIGRWWETDKPQDNRCFLDIQCPSTSCCAHFPDSNNRRCILKTEDKVSQTLGPVTFTPSCPTIAGGQTPENAQDDIAAGALSKANDELDSWRAGLLKDAKTDAGYDTDACDAACKAKFDADEKAKKDKYDDFVDELKALVDFGDAAKCNVQCQTVFNVDLLSWEKEVYETCKADSKQIACREANAIKKDTETGRGNAYYTGTPEQREAADKARKEARAALEATLTAAWVKNNKPAEGEKGSDCTKKDGPGDDIVGALVPADVYSCKSEFHCCGDATRKDGAFVNDPLEKICLPRTDLTYIDGLNREYTFKCLESAIKLASTAATAVLAAYYM